MAITQSGDRFESLSLKIRLAWQLLLVLWIPFVLFVLGGILSLVTSPFWILYLLTMGLWQPPRLLYLSDYLYLAAIIPAVLSTEFIINYIFRQATYGPRGFQLVVVRAVLLTGFVISVLRGQNLGLLFPIGSTVWMFLMFILFYEMPHRLASPSRLSRLKGFVRSRWLLIVTNEYKVRNVLSPLVLVGFVLLTLPWASNWEWRLLFPTSLHLMAFVLSIPVVIIAIVLGRAAGLSAGLVLKQFSQTETHRYWVETVVTMVCFAEVASFFSADLPQFVVICSLTPVSWLVARVFRNRGSRLLGITEVAKRPGFWPTLTTQFRRGRANVTVLAILLILLSGFLIGSREAIASSQSSELLSPVRVAVMDSGINRDDPVLRHHVVAARSFVTVENGFSSDEDDPSDLNPSTPHGTIVARCVHEVFESVSLINAKVGNSSDYITWQAVKSAIAWCVEEANASVIDLSFGNALYDVTDSEREGLFEWVRSRGVLIVVAAGNSQPGGGAEVHGTVQSLAAYPYVVTVGAVDSSGHPYWWSSTGPSPLNVMKPDLVALGSFWNDDSLAGTSFAAPRVAGAAALLIDALANTDTSWSPEVIKAALLAGARVLEYPPYHVGAGLLDAEESLVLLDRAPRSAAGLPRILSVLQNRLPLDYEFLFGNVNYTASLQISCSERAAIECAVSSSIRNITMIRNLTVGPDGLLELTIRPPSSSLDVFYSGHVNITWDDISDRVDIEFVARPARGHLGIVTCYDARNPSTCAYMYSRYRDILCKQGIALTEIRNRTFIRSDYLAQFDAVVLIDPFTSYSMVNMPSFTPQERQALETFAAGRHGLLVAYGDSNATLFNEMFGWTGVALWDEEVYLFDWRFANGSMLDGLEDDLEGLVTYDPRPLNSTGTNCVALISGGLLWEDTWYNVSVYVESPGRLLMIAWASWFTNEYVGNSYQDSTSVVDRMTKWVLGLL